MNQISNVLSPLSEKSNELQIHGKIQNKQKFGYNDNNNKSYKKNFWRISREKNGKKTMNKISKCSWIIWFRWKSLIEQKNFSQKLRSFDFIYLF